MNDVCSFRQVISVAVRALVMVTLFNAAPVFAEDDALEKRIEGLENRTRELERAEEEEKVRWEELAEAWYWTSIPYPDIRDQRPELTIGKINPTALFDANAVANSETSQFIADIFVNNLALEFGDGPGLSMGYRFTSIYNKGLNVAGRVGLFEGDGDFKLVSVSTSSSQMTSPSRI